jgi:3-phosphoshikimate 1-carboxyvinyltransferase
VPCRDWIVRGGDAVRGSLTVPGDKSISHRALLLGALAHGDTRVWGWLRGADCLATAAALRTLGVPIAEGAEGELTIAGAGPEAWGEPGEVLDVGNSGTTFRLLTGLLAGRPFFSVLTGDASLRRRPMRRVVEPLRAMGAAISGRAGGEYPPLALQGGPLRGIAWRSPVASAQVKSALLLAGFQAAGETSVSEPFLSRDHTERMLPAFGVPVQRDGSRVSISGGQRLRATSLRVPGDLSSAAFFLAAAAIDPAGEVEIRGVGVNPTRTGILGALERMGARIRRHDLRAEAGEPVADLGIRGGRLTGIRLRAAEIPALIDELPILAVAALFAEGETLIEGAAELRVKEVDRLAALEGELSRLGGEIRVEGDTLRIRGGRRLTGGTVESRGDHRMAMSLAVAALFAEGETTIRDVGCVDTSFPGFADALRSVTSAAALREVG